jgi:hypothetical protein
MVMARTVTVTEPDCFGVEIEVAVMVTGKFAAGGLEGAVYVTEVVVGLLRVPTAGMGEVMAHDVGSTPIFAGSKLTVAVIIEVPLGQGRVGQNCTELGFAERETAMAAKVIPMDPCVAGGLADVAVMITCTSLVGGVEGAVYVTVVLVGLLRVPAPVAGEMVQEAGLTCLFAGSLVTIAVISEVPAGQG